MNVLQSFMGCMYPGSIKTESIESLDHDPSCRYQVSNIDETGRVISKGQIQLTDRDLIYFRPGKFPIRWPIRCIRRYGCTDGGEIFTFETGRKSPTGEAIYAFLLSNGLDLVKKLKTRIDKNSTEENADQNDNPNCSAFNFNRNCFYTCSSNQETPTRSLLEANNDRPRCIDAETHSRINYTNIVTNSDNNDHPSRNHHRDQESNRPEPTNYTDINTIVVRSPDSPVNQAADTIDIKPLPYSHINANVTQSLNELVRAHAVNNRRLSHDGSQASPQPSPL